MKKLITFLLMLISISIIAAPPGENDSYSLQFGNDEQDSGVEAIYKSQEDPIQPVKQTPDTTTPLTAEKQLEKFMNEKGFDAGWDTGKKRIFVKEIAAFDCESPAIDSDFLVKREMKVKEAILRAKIEIIQTINSEMSAEEKLNCPGTPLREKFYAKLKEAQKKMDLLKRRLEKLKAYMDKKEADMLAGVTWNDRGKALMDGIIKKIDKKFSTGEIEADKKAKYEASKKAYEEGAAEMATIEEQAKALNGQITSEMSSSVEILAEMPLFGATVIAQTESWNEEKEQYQVAVLVCWSSKLQDAAMAVATGKEVKLPPNKMKETIHEWLKKQDLAVISGPRQYLDNKGNRWYIGVSARALPEASSMQRRARSLADINAKQMAVYCIYSNLASKQKAGQMMQERNAGKKDINQVAESMAENLTNSFKNKNIRGLAKIDSKTLTHPISGEEIYVAVYGINPELAKKTLEIEAESYGIAIESNKYQAEQKGIKDSFKDSVKQSENDTASYNEGYSKGIDELSNNTAQQSKKQNIKSTNTINNSRNGSSGSFMGDTNVEDDF